MEVPYEREEEEVIGAQDLQTRHRSSHLNTQNQKSFDSSTSSSDSSTSDSIFEYSVSMDTEANVNTTTVSFTNGEKPQIIEGTSVIEETLSHAEEERANSESEEPNKRENAINVAHNGESNGFTKELNGDGVVEYPTLPESNGGYEESDNGAITSSFSKSPEIAVGLKYVESLLNESSNSVNGMPSDIFNAENIVNKTVTVSGQHEIAEAGGSQEVELEAEEFDVERVIHKQETHDLICPYCNHDITKRVILKRRKRKIQQISGGAEDIRTKPDPNKSSIAPGEDLDLNKRKLEHESSQLKSAPDDRINAISCFSCFSIFVPKGDGFLWWRFTPKSADTLQTDDPSDVYIVPEESANVKTGNAFPLWIMTCCQPYHTEKPVPKPDSIPPSTLEEGKKTQPNESELPSPSSHDPQESSRSQSSIVPEKDSELPPSREPIEGTLLPPTSELPVPITLVNGEDSPLWFLTCCQPSENRTKPEHAPRPDAKAPISEKEPPKVVADDKPVDPIHQPPTLLGPDTPSAPKRLTPIKPVEETMLPPEEQPLVTPTGEKDSSLWFLACCQPASEGKKQKSPEKPDLLALPLQSESPVPPPPSKDKPLTSTQPSIEPNQANTNFSKTSTSMEHASENSIPHEAQSIVTPAGAFPLWFVTCCQPSTDVNEPKPATKQGKTAFSPEVETEAGSEDGTEFQHHDKISHSAQSGGTAIQHHDTEPPSAQSSDTPIPPTSGPPITSETWLAIPPKPLPPIKLDMGIPSPPEPEAPPTPPKGEVTMPVLEEQPIPQPFDSYETGPTPDIEQPLIQHPRELARAGISGLDIVKAIVYGGLLECITSLSVITSAAGGDATTLNIVALGLANVFGGLLILLHNLRVLKHEHATERYEDQLGRPGHFLLHAIVAVLSYLIFGLMSPIIYGFAFRKSDNKDYKLATLAAASLLCIAILSIGKAYVRRPPKVYFQTFFYYISIGFMVSGLGYVTGNLINMLLKKLGVFDSRTAPVSMTEAWSTY